MADQPVIERLRAWTSQRQLPLTPRRLAIAELLLNSPRHLSAEELIASLASNGVKVGTATVYRTIAVLLESGLVVERDRGEGFRRFEPKRDLPHQEQLLCTVCGRAVEFRDPALDRLTSRVAESHGFVRARHHMVVYGSCADCSGAAISAGAGAHA